jgi:hypothetical protein
LKKVKKNEIQEITHEKKESNSTQTVNVKSVNQQGGITANQVNIYNKEPEPLIEIEIIRILNSINPAIIERYKNGQPQICVMINQYNIMQLSKIKIELGERKLLTFKSNGSVNMGRGNQIGNCINDLDEGNLNGYNITFLENFNSILNR